MLHDCDTCDETFDNDEARQSHMRDLNHFINSDTSEKRNTTPHRIAASSSTSSSSSSSDSESSDLKISANMVPDTKNDALENMQLSDLSCREAEEQGVRIPTSALSMRSRLESTKQWAATQNPHNTIPIEEDDEEEEDENENDAVQIQTPKKKKRKRGKRKGKGGDQSLTVKCETCDMRFVNREAVGQHMLAKEHFRTGVLEEGGDGLGD
ncbi:hypothetical protein EG328_007706 [Venturia inaequalis]|uniref:C2H2-type domain-containing protein n=1 Tax=Venturia inaequalis TaxID=5025 RepID=A0A8H3V316_VENIN|nr:hypothetical protein EG328_007706 [Venturia inaequalis]KAE9980137.1 hypothetical protein EG327_006686 [Venturia inaequalis]